jgi:DNA-binding response OmpR family regulator
MASRSGVSGGPVLLIEDDGDIREALSELLSDDGHSVFVAVDGADALSLLDTGRIPRPCLILLDWLMQPMSGQQFLEALQRRQDADHLRVLIVTGATDVHHGSSAVVGVLPKPFEIATLLALVSTHCHRSPPHSALV